MRDTSRWVIVVVGLVLVIALLAFARGRLHHRGDEVGALRRTSASFMVMAR